MIISGIIIIGIAIYFNYDIQEDANHKFQNSNSKSLAVRQTWFHCKNIKLRLQTRSKQKRQSKRQLSWDFHEQHSALSGSPNEVRGENQITNSKTQIPKHKRIGAADPGEQTKKGHSGVSLNLEKI